MDTLESLFILIQKNFLDIITLLWIIWFSGVALGVVVSTVSSCRSRVTLTRLNQRYEHARRRRDRGAILFKLDPERIKKTLDRRERELGADARRMRLDFGVQGVLGNFRTRIQQRLADLPATERELAGRLRKIYGGLKDFQDVCGSDQVFLARMALKRGEPGKAVALLKRAQSLGNQEAAKAERPQLAAARNKRQAANGAFLLGQLAETEFNYFTAVHYYQLAAALEPANPTYVQVAGELSYAFGEFQETGHLLEKVLTTQVKLLGPEDAGLVQTLNNLGVLRHAQGRPAEAEAFYLWALEICDVNRYPQDQDAANLMRNYGALLREVGRHLEADAVKARARDDLPRVSWS
jgi:tetratricopeptide (TPR) repeat protein